MALTRQEHCPRTAYVRLQEALMDCEADELPEEEVAEARQELYIYIYIYPQAGL